MADWEGILRDEGPAVWRTLWRLLGHRADVDECFQETFLGALEYARRENVRHWSALLQRVATTKAVDRLRQRYRSRGAVDDSIDADVVASSRPGPVELVVAAEQTERLRRALARLPEVQAEAFCLHALSGWSYDEIGRQTGMSSSAVGVTIHRARKRLRELLGEGAPEQQTTTGGVS
jgi:RNA polymerase sigma-70 factor (ECF subfamily)